MLLLASSVAVGASTDPRITSYCATSRALYAWNCSTTRTLDGQSSWWHVLHDTNGCGQRLVDFAVSHRFARVYLFVGALEWHWEGSFAVGELPDQDAVADLTTRLRAAGVEPWAMWYANDDPDDLDGAERVADLVAAVDAFGATWPAGAFAGVHGDQEPNATRVLDAYLAMNTTGLAAAQPLGLGYGASLKPAWLTLPPAAPFVGEVLPGLTLGTLMDYTDDPVRLQSQAETFLDFADAAGVAAEIAVETGWGDPTPGVSLGELVRTDPAAFYGLVGDLDAALAPRPTYTGVAVHDFAQYFAHLHGGVEPYDFVGAVPVLCPVEEDTAAPGDTGAPTDTGAPPTDTAGPTTGTTPVAPPADPPASDERGCGCAGPRGHVGVPLVAGLLLRRRSVTIPSGVVEARRGGP